MTKTYLALLRGINVGGKNRVPMLELKTYLEELGYQNVRTYIASGNVLFESTKSAPELTKEIETLLPKKFSLDSELIKVLVLSRDQLQAVVDNKPQGFGDQPQKHHSDVIFLINVHANEAITAFSPRDGVDAIWQGDGVVYSQRLSELRTKSRLNKVTSSSMYKSMTIRTWNTTLKLLELM